jgi:hypothetical protein
MLLCLLQVRWLNRLLDLCHWYLLSARVMLTQHTAALHSLEQQTAAVSSPGGHGRTEPVVAGAAASATAGKATVAHYHEPGHRSTDPAQAYTPPHQQLVDMQPVSLIARNAPVMRIVRNVAEDCRYVQHRGWRGAIVLRGCLILAAWGCSRAGEAVGRHACSVVCCLLLAY